MDNQTQSRPLIIRRVDAIPVALPLQNPVAMSGGTIAHAHNLLVRIEARDGTVGWGEAASAPTMTGDTLGGLKAAVSEHFAPLLIGRDAWMRAPLGRAMRAALVGNTGAHSAVEMALLDLVARTARLRLIDLVGGPVRCQITPMWLLGHLTPEADLAEASEKQARGFNFFKLKVAAKPLAADIETTHALRRALGTATICADANCGFVPAAARRYLDATRDADLMFLEQPLVPTDLAGLKALTRTSPVPIGADEGIHSISDIEAHARCAAAGVSLKLIKLGGLTAAISAATLCERLGLQVNVAAKVAESSLASAAALHLACAISAAEWGVSLTHFYLADDIVKKPITLHDGSVALPNGPGLGVEVDEAAVARFRLS